MAKDKASFFFFTLYFLLCSLSLSIISAAMAEASTVIFRSTLLPSMFSQNHHLPYSKPFRTKTLNSPSQIRCSISTTDTPFTAVDRIPWGCEVDSVENAEALQKWLSGSGLPPQKMRIEKVDVGERGLVANNNIRKGEKLLFVPPSLVISADSVSSLSDYSFILLLFLVFDEF